MPPTLNEGACCVGNTTQEIIATGDGFKPNGSRSLAQRFRIFSDDSYSSLAEQPKLLRADEYLATSRKLRVALHREFHPGKFKMFIEPLVRRCPDAFDMKPIALDEAHFIIANEFKMKAEAYLSSLAVADKSLIQKCVDAIKTLFDKVNDSAPYIQIFLCLVIHDSPEFGPRGSFRIPEKITTSVIRAHANEGQKLLCEEANGMFSGVLQSCYHDDTERLVAALARGTGQSTTFINDPPSRQVRGKQRFAVILNEEEAQDEWSGLTTSMLRKVLELLRNDTFLSIGPAGKIEPPADPCCLQQTLMVC